MYEEIMGPMSHRTWAALTQQGLFDFSPKRNLFLILTRGYVVGMATIFNGTIKTIQPYTSYDFGSPLGAFFRVA